MAVTSVNKGVALGLGLAVALIVLIYHWDILAPATTKDGGLPTRVETGMSQLDPILWQLIAAEHFIQPSKEDYRLEKPNAQPSMGQGQTIAELFQNKRGGFFIECGALDGETRSNTLALERDLGWTGLLIEGDPTSIPKIKAKNRKSLVVPNCLSTRTETMEVNFGAWFNVGRILSPNEKKDDRVVSVMCLPLYSVLKAAGVTHVDYFSLDVEGNELDVLKTIPFDLVDITALSVEFKHIGEKHTGGSKNELLEFMESKGYKSRAIVKNARNFANDYIFVKTGFNEHIELKDISTE